MLLLMNELITAKNMKIYNELFTINMTIYDRNRLILIENNHFNRK